MVGMWAFKYFSSLILVINFVLFLQVTGGADNTDANPITTLVRSTLVTTAKHCLRRVNASEADLEYLRSAPPYPERAACIVKCLLEKIGVVKNDHYSKTGFLTIVAPLVFHRKSKLDHMRTVADQCDKEVPHEETNRCQLGNEVPICIYKYAPELQIHT